MQYPVPQFLDVEDTVVGPLTVKQTLYLATGFAISLMATKLFVGFVAILITIPAILISIAFAFYKPNGRPLVIYVANFISFTFKPQLYVWRRNPEGALIKRSIRRETAKDSLGAEAKIVSRNRLQELAWVLDTQQAMDAEGTEGERG